MDHSRRAVEAYWRSRMVDAVTSDEDKVAPVYKLEEICELLRTSPAGTVKEVSDYILKRLDHKSPVVKQKALRVIKYAVGKSGADFRREMQRHSAAMRQLFHYKGQPDPLKGDALNKAVRDTAHDAIAAIFSPDDLKAAAVPAEGVNKRIEGFGNTNYSMPVEHKKSFLSEVAEMVPASLKQGLNTFTGGHLVGKEDNGSFSSYKSPNLRSSLTTELDSQDRSGGYERPGISGISKEVGSGTWGADLRTSITASAAHEDADSGGTGVKTREERLLETIVTSGGVRLHPTRDMLQVFLAEASKLDALSISRAIETKLQSPLWQVRMKAICVLESILRKKDDENFAIIASYFNERKDPIVKCSELPQASLRERAFKVLNLLDGEDNTAAKGHLTAPSDLNPTPSFAQIPDLIDTGDFAGCGGEDLIQSQMHQNIESHTSPSFLANDMFNVDPVSDTSMVNKGGSEDDPFADVSFHADGMDDNLFSGLSVDNKTCNHELNGHLPVKTDLLDIFGANSDEQLKGAEKSNKDVHDMMSDLSLSGSEDKDQMGVFGVASESISFVGSSQPTQFPSGGAPFHGIFGMNGMFPMGSMQQNLSINQIYGAQTMNYAAMGNFIAQQQLLFQNVGNMNDGISHSNPNAMDRNNPSPLPDIFKISNNQVQSHASMLSVPKKEETKAFDFITDHISAARSSKKII